jgi:hypothetical protein
MTGMTPRFRPIFEDCLERGISRGYARAHKHVEKPSDSDIFENIHDTVMSELYEYFDFLDSDELS